jgi:hypothetical protein
MNTVRFHASDKWYIRAHFVHQDVSWIPRDIAARAIVDIALAPTSPSPHQVVHLAHPRPVAWPTLMGYIATTQGVPLVPYAYWLAALESNLADRTRLEVERLRANPALRMIGFFRAMAPLAGSEGRDPAYEAMGVARMDVRQGLAASPTLRNAPQLGPQDANKWMAYWERARAREVYGEFWDSSVPSRT